MQNNMFNYKNTLSIAFLLLVVGVFSIIWQKPFTTLGSVTTASEYLATTTAQMTAVHNPVAPNKVVTLGSIIVASSSATTFQVWNATSTTDIASTSVMTLKASIGEGTYTIDSIMTRGIIVETPSGFNGEYIVTFRP